MANFKVEPNKGESGKTNVRVTAEAANNDTGNRTLGSVVFTTEDGSQKAVRVFQYGKTVFEVERPNPMASTDTQVSFIVHSWYHGAYSAVNVYTPVGTASSAMPVGGDVLVTISNIPENPGATTKTYNVILTQDATGNTITLPIVHTAEEQPVPVVHTFTVSPASLSLEEGELNQLSCLYDNVALDLRLVTFTSSDTSVLTVDANGTVTAVSRGAAEITVVYNNTDPTDGNVYTQKVPAIIREAQVIPTTCSIVFNVVPAGSSVSVNGLPISGYTYTATIGTPFTYTVTMAGYIPVSDTYTPTGNATINITLSEKVVTGIERLPGAVELSYNTVSAAGIDSNFYPNTFNVPFKALYNNGTQESGFFVSGSLINNQWRIQTNLPVGLNYEFSFTYISDISGVEFNKNTGVFTVIPENTGFAQRTVGRVDLRVTGQINQLISQANVTQLESTQKIISSITIGTSGRTSLSYPSVSAVGETVLPNYYHLPLNISYTNGTTDSTTYYLDKLGDNLPSEVVPQFKLNSNVLPTTGSVTVEENPTTLSRSLGPINLSVIYSGNTVIVDSCYINQVASTFLVNGNNTMQAGSTTQLTALFNGNNVTSVSSWSTSSSALATINNGLVTALDDGNVTITAAYKDAAANKVITIQQTITLVVTEEFGRDRFKIGEDTHFTLIVETSDGRDVPHPTFTHDGEPGDITFDDNYVVFNNTGNYTITATYDGMTGTIQFSAVELTSLELTSEANSLTYGAFTRFSAVGTYSDGVVENINERSTLQIVSGGAYCTLVSGRLTNTNEATTHSYTNMDVYALANDIQDGNIEIRGTFTGVPDDTFTLCYKLVDVLSGTAQNTVVKATYAGVESNTVTIILYPQAATGTQRTGFVTDDNVTNSDSSVATISSGVVTLLDLSGSDGSTTFTVYYNEEQIGTLNVNNVPQALYLSTDALGTTHATDFTINPNTNDGSIPVVTLYAYNQTSVSRRFKVADTGFRRWNYVAGQTLDYDHIITNNLTSYTAIARPSNRYNGSPLALTIPITNAISTCTSTYKLYRFENNGSSVVVQLADDSIVITETMLGIFNMDITTFWYLPINAGDQYAYPRYAIDVTYGKGVSEQVITFTQDTFDTDFFSHTPYNSTLVGFWMEFQKTETYVVDTTVDVDTGVVSLPGTATEDLAKIRLYCQDTDADDIDGDYAYTIVGESIKLDVVDQLGIDVIDRDNSGTPDYWIAKNLTINTSGNVDSQGITRFKVYHNGEDVTTQCLYEITNTSYINTLIPPTVNVSGGYCCVTMTNQTGYCTLHITLQTLQWTAEKYIDLHFAQTAMLGSDNHVQWYSLELPINLGGSFTEVPVHLWADFTGTLTDMVYDRCGTLPAGTPVALALQDTSTRVIVRQFTTGRCTAYLAYKNLTVEAAVISQ